MKSSFLHKAGLTTFTLMLSIPAIIAQPAPDNRKDWYEIQHLPQHVRVANAVLHHTGSSLLIPNKKGFDFKVKAWRYATNNVSDTLCPSTRFFGQLVPRPVTGSTAMLVGQDVVIVPRHTWNGAASDTTPQLVCQSGRRVFLMDYKQKTANDPPVGNDNITTLPFDADQVYQCDSVLGYGQPGDWVVIKLNRPLPMNNVPLKIRRFGDPAVGDSPARATLYVVRLLFPSTKQTTGTLVTTGSSNKTKKIPARSGIDSIVKCMPGRTRHANFLLYLWLDTTYNVAPARR